MYQNENCDEYEVELINNGLFLKYSEELPTVLQEYFTKEEYEDIIKRINKYYRLQGYILILCATCILFPVAIYFIIKSIMDLTNLIVETTTTLREKDMYLRFLITMKTLEERKAGSPKQKIIFLYPKNGDNSV